MATEVLFHQSMSLGERYLTLNGYNSFIIVLGRELISFLGIDEFRIIDAMLNWGARFENRGSDISLKLRRNIA